MRAWVIPYVMESIGLEPPQIRDAPKAREDLMSERGAVRFSGVARKKRRAATLDSSPAGRAI